MPIIYYNCQKCKKRFEVFQRITDTPLKKCSFCGGKVLKTEDPFAPNLQAILYPFQDEGKKVEKSKEKKYPAKRAKKK